MKRGLILVAAAALLLLGAWPGSSAAGRSDWLVPTGPDISAMGGGVGPEPKGDRKIASRVMQAAQVASALSQAQADQRAYPTRLMAGIARFDDQGRLEVYITVEEVTEKGALTTLRNAGVEIEIYDASQRLVQGWVSSAQLQAVADLPGVRFIDLPNYGVTNTGSVITEGDGVIRADQLRAIGLTGSGVKVGVISDGINGLTSSITSSDLPASGITMPAAPLTGGGISLDSPLPGATMFTSTPVGRPDLTTGSEGRALLEIIHDVATGAQLFFAPGFTSSLGFQRAARWLVAQGVKVVADDVVHFNAGPYDGTSVVSREAAAAVASGSSYFVAVGNYAQEHYQGLFTDTDGDGFHEFDVSLGLPRVDNAGETLNVTLQPGETVSIDLQWNDPFGASTNDYDLCVHDPADIPSSFLFCSTDPQTGTQNPTEALAIMRSPSASGPGTLGVRINKVGMAAPRVFDLFVLGGVMNEFIVPESSVPNKADAGGGVISVGAVRWQTPTIIESFSSRGPTNNGSLKPELVAPDGVATSFPSGSDFNPFFGTSAAVPHAAGIAALLLSRFPRMTPGQLRRALLDATLDLGPLGADNTYGHGLMDGSVFTRMRVLHP